MTPQVANSREYSFFFFVFQKSRMYLQDSQRYKFKISQHIFFLMRIYR